MTLEGHVFLPVRVGLDSSSRAQIFSRRSRKEFAMTDTELKLMAAAAITGLRSKPDTG
jgi:hypothetical protein